MTLTADPRSEIVMPVSENAGLEPLAFMLDVVPDLSHAIGSSRSGDVTVLALLNSCEIGADIGKIHPIVEADRSTEMRDLRVIKITSALHCSE